MDDEFLINAVKDGEIDKFALLVHKHSGNVFALANSLLKNREDAEEVAQDVFMKALKALDGFRGDSKFSSFLYRICYNESVNKMRARKIFLDIEDIPVKECEIKDGFYQMVKEDQKKYLNLALRKLNPDYSMVLALFYLEEQSYNEIVEISGMSLSNVKVKIHRAKNALAKILNEMLKEERKYLY